MHHEPGLGKYPGECGYFGEVRRAGLGGRQQVIAHSSKAASRSRLVLAAVIGAPIILAAVVLGPTAFDLAAHRRPPDRYIVPAGFRGWTRIDYRQASASPLPVDRGERVLKLDAQGRLQASDSPPSGYAKDEYFAAGGTGLQPLPYLGICKGGMVWGLETRTDDHTGLAYARFFVGDEGEYRHEVDSTGKNFPSC